jgi:O-antigen ligase
VPFGLAIFGVIISSINWMSGDVVHNIMRQGAFAYNFVLAPFLLLPIIYLRMGESRDNAANLKGLLFFLIIPSTLILISAKLFGTVANEWEASLHVKSLPEGFIQYRLGKVTVNFLRTEVGFILAALICASTAVAISRVKALYKWLAGACLVSNTFLLLATGSFGSGFACFCGLAAIFCTQSRVISVTRCLTVIAAIAIMLFLTYSLSPPSVKEYLGKRYEHRVTNANADRLLLWGRAIENFFEHPEGVGLTLKVGDIVETYIHNDYLTYAVSYGVTGGLAYTSLVAGLMIYFFRSTKRIIKDHSALAIHLAGLGVIVAIAVNSMTDQMNSNRWYFNTIWSVVWYSYFCSRAAHAETGPEG